MKLIAARACPACARAGFLSIFLLLGGCGALPLSDKPVRPQPYDLGPALPQAASAAPSGPALALGRVDAPPAIDGSNIVYRLMYSDAGQQPRPYALARWTMAPPQLLAQRLREAFSATRTVVEPGAGLAAGADACAAHALDALLDPQKRLAGLLKEMEEEHMAL